MHNLNYGHVGWVFRAVSGVFAIALSKENGTVDGHNQNTIDCAVVSPALCYKMSYQRLVGLHHSHLLYLLFAYFFLRIDMMFNFFTLFSGVALLSSAAAQGTIHQIMVGNDTGGTIYNPNNIVRQLKSYLNYTIGLTVFLPECSDRRYRSICFPSQESLRDAVQLCRTMHAIGWRIRFWLVRLVRTITFQRFSRLHSHPVAIGTSDDFPTFSITVNDVRVNSDTVSRHVVQLTSLDSLDESHLGTLRAGCKHSG